LIIELLLIQRFRLPFSHWEFLDNFIILNCFISILSDKVINIVAFVHPFAQSEFSPSLPEGPSRGREGGGESVSPGFVHLILGGVQFIQNVSLHFFFGFELHVSSRFEVSVLK